MKIRSIRASANTAHRREIWVIALPRLSPEGLVTRARACAHFAILHLSRPLESERSLDSIALAAVKTISLMRSTSHEQEMADGCMQDYCIRSMDLYMHHRTSRAGQSHDEKVKGHYDL